MLNIYAAIFNISTLRKAGGLLAVVLVVVLAGLVGRDYLQSLTVTTQVYDLTTGIPYQGPRCERVESNQRVTTKRADLLANEFSLLVWNVYKYQDPEWPQTLMDLLDSHDIAVLQEARSDATFSQFWLQRGWQGYGSSAFSQDGHWFGVQNLAKVTAQLVCVELTPEPWIQIPKSTLTTLYPLANRDSGLLVINVHGINFTLGTAEWEGQLLSLFDLVERHHGPVILAGDFNTWSASRQLSLSQLVANVGLNEVTFSPDHRLVVMGEALDHVYYKGLEVVSAQALALPGSDHFPMEVRFNLQD
ncbi:endonuclease/exonuclease/phosphatase family protein [Motilimonas eburnea]|uniref:endonuclease/exonuclease/phosphatase family protein n=1 Tax=Motilimonas eburnea TaxID=1737488 RepID=UPI001E453263|nr:endonuclease/exonuclease/phosphatase family protein [Motilimonas eburnea]MCE2571612.1 endonuclease/exonuclease/phosphatase family protein [Motilimonas eburnea]